MSTTPISLPDRPNLEQLKKRARELQRETGVKLTQAQTDLARLHGFPSWPKLVKHVELVTQLTRTPDLVPPSTDPVDEFLRSVCLNYGNNDRTDMAPRPSEEIATANVWAAAATGSYEAIADQDATLVGGPFAWEPLMYLCYSRVEMSEMHAVVTARLLLKGGADPNVGYLWHGLPSPFTALTGVFGNGEGSQPPHAHSVALARVLLEHGADPSDSQTLYNRQFQPGVEHLELLFEFGLGKGEGGPWKARMGNQMESPFEMVQHQLRWAIHHNMLDRVQLFAAQGVDLTTPFDGAPAWATQAAGRRPADFAVLCGQTRIVEELAKHGATPAELSEVDRFVGAILAGQTLDASAAVEHEAHQQRPSLVVQAAATGRMEAVRAAVGRGFDVNALGRADAPAEQPWQTALHTAVEHDNAEIVELLLELGADPSIKDARFSATPKDWAEHFGNERMAALLP